MDANGLKFWMLADQADWSLESDAVEFETASRTVHLARHQEVTVFPADELVAEARLDVVPQSLDQFGTRAFWSTSLNSVIATGAAPGGVALWTAPAGAEATDVALGYDNVLYVAVAGRIVIIDPRERFLPTAAASIAGFTAWRLAARPDGGVWALDRESNRLGRLLGSPSTVRPHPAYDPNT